MEIYSPGRMSRWIPDNACVSTSSVRNTFVTLLSRIRESDPLFMIELLISDCADCRLVESNAFVRIPGAGIRKNHLISRLQAAQNLNRVNRALAKLNGCAHSFPAAVDELKHSDGVVLLAKRRTTHINDVVETLELDCSIHAKIGPRAFWQRLIERNINSNCSLLDCGIDARDVARDSAVAGIDHRALLNLNIFRLRLSDLDLRF